MRADALAVPSGTAAVTGFAPNVLAFTTTRVNGSFGLGSGESVADVMHRWATLRADLAVHGVRRLASAHQVHGSTVVRHRGGWIGWLRGDDADGHVTDVPGTALAVTVADCTPVLVAHPRGAIAALHAGWRGTAAGILDQGLDALDAMGYAPEECTVALGPAICGTCYEVGPEVLEAVHGRPATTHGYLDVRAVLADQAHTRRVAHIHIDTECTRCDNDRFFSHRAGDPGRQLGVIALAPSSP